MGLPVTARLPLYFTTVFNPYGSNPIYRFDTITIFNCSCVNGEWWVYQGRMLQKIYYIRYTIRCGTMLYTNVWYFGAVLRSRGYIAQSIDTNALQTVIQRRTTQTSSLFSSNQRTSHYSSVLPSTTTYQPSTTTCDSLVTFSLLQNTTVGYRQTL